MIPKSARQLDKTLQEQSLESLRHWRDFNHRFVIDVFKGALDSLAWDRLTRRELCCLILRYYPFPERPSGLTYEEVGSLFRITRERVRQIVKAAILKLERKYYKSERHQERGEECNGAR